MLVKKSNSTQVIIEKKKGLAIAIANEIMVVNHCTEVDDFLLIFTFTVLLAREKKNGGR